MNSGGFFSCLHFLSSPAPIVNVTHNIQQARRLADDTAYLLLGKLIERALTCDIFINPQRPETERDISGQMG